MSNWVNQTAHAFMRHWIFPERTLAQCDLGRRLVQMGYPIQIDLDSFSVAEPTAATEPMVRAVKLQEYAWALVESSLRETIRQQISPADGKYIITEKARLSQSILDWYPGWRLLEVVDPEWANPRLRLYYLLDPHQNLFRLNGTSPPIHEANALAPLRLDQANILSYLTFFCFFVRGEEGPFHCIEALDDPLIEVVMQANEEYPNLLPARIAIEGTIRPLTLEEMDEQGNYLCDGTVYYSNAIFIAHFAVRPSGMVDMLDDEPVAADLPYKLDSPIT